MKKTLTILLLGCLSIFSLYSEMTINTDDLNNTGVIELDTEWDFYWDELISPEQSQDFIIEPDFNGKMNYWNFLDFPSYGVGTYRLILNLEGENTPETLGLEFYAIYSAYRLYINGKLIASEGVLGQTADTEKSRAPRSSVFFGHDDDRLDIILQVSNHHYLTRGGIGGPPFIGSSKTISIRKILKSASNLFMVAAFLFMGLYHIFLTIFRSKDKASLYLGLFSLTVAFRVFFITGDKIVFYIIPWLQMPLFDALQKLGIYPLVPFFILYITNLFPKEKNTLINYFFIIVTSILLIAEYVFLSFNLLNIFYPIILLALIYIFYVIIKALINKRPESPLTAAGFVFILLVSINDILQGMLIIETDYYLGIGFLIFFFFQTLILARRFTRAFSQVEILSQNLVSTNKALKKMDLLKDEFLTNTSHELRTPLHGIIGLAESLQDSEGKKIGIDEIESLNLISSSGKRLSNLVDDILDFSKMKNKDLELKMNPVSMKEITSIVLNLSAHLIKDKDIKFLNSIPENIPTVLGDENRLQQIMYNLVGNSIKFTKTGKIIVSAIAVDEYIKISVCDTGIGISEDRFDSIFDSFEQVDASIAREYGGTGIGLAITKQLVELHNGSISVKSTLGEGSTFSFKIPISGKKASKIEDNIRVLNYNDSEILDTEDFDIPMVSTEKEFKILIVDDEPINLKVYTSQLANKNYEIRQASDGLDTLKIIEEGYNPDIVLLDVMMPKMTGYDVAKKLRERFSSHELPIIMITAKNRINDLVYAFDVGANDYIAKPFTKKELLSRVQIHLTLKRAFDKNKELTDNLEEKVIIRTKELKSANIELSNKNNQIMDSISYASTIQQSILPPPDVLEQNLNEFFTLWKPKDVVGGDFYWFSETEKGCLLAVCDCTGHGVPGAFMTMTVNSVLSRITSYYINDNPALILKELNKIIRSLLNQDTNKSLSDDGLDMGLCYFNKSNKNVTFSGAKISLRILQGETITEIKGDKQSLGYYRSKEDFEYTNNEIEFNENQIFYLISDGFQDQNGGDKDYSFGRKRLNEMILKYKDKSLSAQEECFEKELKEYMGDESQRDDITVVGFKF